VRLEPTGTGCGGAYGSRGLDGRLDPARSESRRAPQTPAPGKCPPAVAHSRVTREPESLVALSCCRSPRRWRREPRHQHEQREPPVRGKADGTTCGRSNRAVFQRVRAHPALSSPQCTEHLDDPAGAARGSGSGRSSEALTRDRDQDRHAPVRRPREAPRRLSSECSGTSGTDSWTH